MKPRALDTQLVLEHWGTTAPSEGFADRVLAACAEPAVAPRRPIGLYACVAALLLAPLAALAVGPHRPSSSTPAIARGLDLDLGLQPD